MQLHARNATGPAHLGAPTRPFPRRPAAPQSRRLAPLGLAGAPLAGCPWPLEEPVSSQYVCTLSTRTKPRLAYVRRPTPRARLGSMSAAPDSNGVPSYPSSVGGCDWARLLLGHLPLPRATSRAMPAVSTTASVSSSSSSGPASASGSRALNHCLVLWPVAPALLSSLKGVFHRVSYFPIQGPDAAPDAPRPTAADYASADAIFAFAMPQELQHPRQTPNLRLWQCCAAGVSHLQETAFFKAQGPESRIVWANATGIQTCVAPLYPSRSGRDAVADLASPPGRPSGSTSSAP